MSAAGRTAELAAPAAGCHVCGAAGRRPFRAAGPWTIVACAGCGLRYLDPQPTAAALAHLYGEAYWRREDPATRGYAGYLADEANARATFRDRLRRLPAPPGPGPGRLLDVGAAAGFFVAEARAAGWDATGVEPSAWAAAIARGRGLPVAAGTLEAAGLAAGSLDLVTLWEVVEHLPAPRATLAEAARVLRPGGTLALSTPDAGSLAARLAGGRWPGWRKVPEHLFFFDRPALARLLGEAGLVVASARHVPVTVGLGFAAGALGRLLGVPLAVPGGLAGVPVSVNPGYDLMIVARKP